MRDDEVLGQAIEKASKEFNPAFDDCELCGQIARLIDGLCQECIKKYKLEPVK